MMIATYHCDVCGNVAPNVRNMCLPDRWYEVNTEVTDPKHFCGDLCFRKVLG